MTIKTRAFLQGYLCDKTAAGELLRAAPGSAEAGKKVRPQEDDLLRAAPGSAEIDMSGKKVRKGILDWWQQGSRKRKAVREKRYTEAFNRDVAMSTDPNRFPGSRRRLIRKGQAEAAALRDWDVSKDGPKPTQTQWNKGPWETLDHPGPPGDRSILRRR